jgi:TonB-linked SusC/RagA family outer membrane protein
MFYLKKNNKMELFLRKICTLMFVLLVSSQLVANTENRNRITLNFKNVTLKTIVSQIEKQTDYLFVYDEQSIDINRRVSVNVQNSSVEDVLKNLLKGTEVTYSIEGKNIVLKRQSKSEKDTQPTPTNRIIRGIVTDTSGEPIIGATILDPVTKNGTITDFKGNFSLEVTDNALLQVSYIGFSRSEIRVGNQQSLSVRLSEDVKALDEVIVIGYGTQSQRLVSTSISRLRLDQIDKGNDADPMRILQGRVTGVNISSSSGTPGSEPNVLIRGIGSVSGSSAPLYVVDGIPAERYPKINPNDISSIEVLKDASAAAIYGSRANTGVIIITTKSGVKGKTKVEASFQQGFGNLSKDIVMANSTEYRNVMQTAIDNYNVQMRTNLSLYVPSVIQETDWVGLISRDVSISRQVSVSVSGGDEKTTFYTSYGYNGQEGYLIKSDYNQHNLRAKFNHKINNWVALNMNIAAAASREDILEETSTSLKVLRTAREEQPWYSPYKDDGFSYKVNGTDLLRHNPLMLIHESDWIANRYSGSGVFSLDITPFRGFKYTPSASLYGVFDDGWKKLSDRHDARMNNSGWYALTQQKDVSFRYVIDNIFTYNNEWDKLTYSTMLGHSFEKYIYERFGAASENYANGAYPSASFNSINVGANIYPGSIGYTGYALESYFGRVSLNWDNRYVFNTSLRTDGSSRFTKGKRYGWFPSASIAWLTSNEDFFEKDALVNDLKMRLSWGATGSMAGVGNFSALSLVSAQGNSYNGSAGFQISQDAQNLTWEKSSTVNAGIDMDLLNSRITLNLDLFYQKTSDLLYTKPVFATTGYTSVVANIGSLDNKGVELAVNGKILDGILKWDLGANVSYTKNSLLTLIDGVEEYVVPGSGSNLLGGTMHILKNGEPISSWYMLKMLGIYQRNDDVPAKLFSKGVRAGDIIYEDINGDGDISDADRQILGKAAPDWVGGISSSLRYKNFDVRLFAQYSIGGKIFAAWKGANGVEGAEHLGLAYANVKVSDKGEPVEQFFNVSKHAATNYWRGEGTSNEMPRPVRLGVHTGYNQDYNVLTSSRYLEDASYFRLKSLSIGYNFSTPMSNKLKLSSLRLFASADNLFTFTKYSGYEPEASFTGNPGSANYGVDFGLQPTLRTFIVGVNVVF